MDEIKAAQDELRKDEQMQREAEAEQKRLAKESQEYLELLDSFGNSSCQIGL